MDCGVGRAEHGRRGLTAGLQAFLRMFFYVVWSMSVIF